MMNNIFIFLLFCLLGFSTLLSNEPEYGVGNVEQKIIWSVSNEAKDFGGILFFMLSNSGERRFITYQINNDKNKLSLIGSAGDDSKILRKIYPVHQENKYLTIDPGESYILSYPPLYKEPFASLKYPIYSLRWVFENMDGMKFCSELFFVDIDMLKSNVSLSHPSFAENGMNYIIAKKNDNKSTTFVLLACNNTSTDVELMNSAQVNCGVTIKIFNGELYNLPIDLSPDGQRVIVPANGYKFWEFDVENFFSKKRAIHNLAELVWTLSEGDRRIEKSLFLSNTNMFTTGDGCSYKISKMNESILFSRSNLSSISYLEEYIGDGIAFRLIQPEDVLEASEEYYAMMYSDLKKDPYLKKCLSKRGAPKLPFINAVKKYTISPNKKEIKLPRRFNFENKFNI